MNIYDILIKPSMALLLLGRNGIIYRRATKDMKPTFNPIRPPMVRQVVSLGAGDGGHQTRGFTLVEVMISLGIIAVVFGAILTAYIQMGRQAEWTGYSLASQAVGIQQIEQARSAVWDYSIGKNELTNLNLTGWTYNATTKVGKGYATSVLDLPISGTNAVVVTNFVTVKLLNLTGLPNVQVQMVMVETVWPLRTLRYGQRLYTNTTATYFGPDNRDASSL